MPIWVMRFCGQAWERVLPIYRSIIEMPFIRELVAGTLPRKSFDFYIEQDSAYLMDFSSLLAVLSSRVEEARHKSLCLKFASHALEAEAVLHRGYLGHIPIVTKEPACDYYVNFLHRTVHSHTAAEGMAALLPCFVVYKRVGDAVLDQARPALDGNPYRDWIEMYSGEDFAEGVQQAQELMEELAGNFSDRDRLLALYEKSSRLEYLFWDHAYKCVTWKSIGSPV